jgi:hypothetical protein
LATGEPTPADISTANERLYGSQPPHDLSPEDAWEIVVRDGELITLGVKPGLDPRQVPGYVSHGPGRSRWLESPALTEIARTG